MDTETLLTLGGFLLACLVAASTSTAFKPGPWYESLRKPFWTPPDWLFPLAWSILYVMMAVAGWMVWQDGIDGASVTVPLTIFAVQLLLNALWAPLFFGAHRIGLGFLLMVTLWCIILVTLMLFLEINTTAGLLLIPYLVWISFAAILNLAIWILNAGQPRAFQTLR